jgi:NitT/TauT family transport system substrate-binding protein
MRIKAGSFHRSIFIFLVLIGLAILTASAAMAASAPRFKPEVTQLKIGLPAIDPTWTPNWASIEKGFFKDEGFSDVKIFVFQGDGAAVQALAGGTVDLNIASLTGLVNSIIAGQKFKAVWAGYNMANFEWYAQPKYKSIAETKGGRYGVSKFGSLTDSLTRFALRKAGLDPEKDVTILQLGGEAQTLGALLANQLDCTILSIPNSYSAAEKGFVKIITQKDNVARDYPTHVIYGQESFIAKNPNTIKAFLRATARAFDWVKANRDEAAKILTKQAKYKPEYSRRSIDEVAYGWYSDGRLPQEQEGMKAFWSIAIQNGDVKEPWPNSRWLDDTFLKTQNEWRK